LGGKASTSAVAVMTVCRRMLRSVADKKT
jgi:hypothetical protein